MLKNCIKCVSVQKRFTGKSKALLKMAESLLYLKESFIFSICVRMEIIPAGSALLPKISPSVSHKWIKSFPLRAP